MSKQSKCEQRVQMNTENDAEPYYSNVFEYKDGILHCEDMTITDVIQYLRKVSQLHTPCFIHSKAKIVSNVNSYIEPLKQLKRTSSLNYAVKANMNITILKLLSDLGCSCTLVSGYELQLCLEVGFSTNFMVLNGNGKQDWEIEMAVKCGCLLNIDSLFNLRRTKQVCSVLGKQARVLLRVNPDIDPNVHKYLETGKCGSKFGVDVDGLTEVLEEIKNDKDVILVGLHCHLGSTITDANSFRDPAIFLFKLFKDLKSDGFRNMKVINIGGGLGISNYKHASKTSEIIDENTDRRVPSPREIVNMIDEIIDDDDVDLIIEPGRTLVGNTAILACNVLGVKKSGSTNYIIVDGSMTEVIRPTLYQAYHHIDLAQPPLCPEDKKVYQIVGPVCESGDFLGKDRYLPTPQEGCLMAVFDVGAYCSSMSSNYNMRPRPTEVLVDKTKCQLIRKPDTFQSMIAPYLI